MDLVSVIMPAYNAEKYIAESIESVIAQTYKYWELIIVDDGSTDNTAKIVKEFSSIDTRVKYFYQPNQQMGKARNTGLQNSKGKLIAFLDSDDIWVPNKLEIQVDFLKKKEVDLVFSDGYAFRDSIDNVEYEYKTIINGEIFGREALSLLMQQNFIPIPSVLAYKSAVIKTDGFNENIEIHNVADYHLWLKLLIGGFKFFGIDEKLFYYRRHDSQSTHSDPYAFEAVLTMFENHFEAPDMKHEIKRAMLLWACKWYKLFGTNRSSANIILNRLNEFRNMRFFTLMIRITMLLLGLKFSRRAVNRYYILLLKTEIKLY